MGPSSILKINLKDAYWTLGSEEILHIARMRKAFWSYDYKVAEDGKVGLHAELKSGRHSDGFIVSKILLEPKNILEIFSYQMVNLFVKRIGLMFLPDYVVGVPDGATSLGERISSILGTKNAQMEKVNGQIRLVTRIEPGKSVMIIEDFWTRGTGFSEAVRAIKDLNPITRIIPYGLVIINRGDMKSINIKDIGEFEIIPLVEHRINDWAPEDCPLCKKGSKAIKPKATEENWLRITTSQL